MNNKTQKKMRKLQDLLNPINGRKYVTTENRLNDIFVQINEKYKKNEITKVKYNEYIKPIIKKQRKICYTKKNKIYCDETNTCLKDTVINKLECGYILDQNDFNEIFKEKETKITDKKGRKNTDYQWSEYVFAVLLKNPEIEFNLDSLEKVNNIEMEHKSEYMKDLRDSYDKKEAFIKKWFTTAKDKILHFYGNYPNINKDTIEVFLMGKTVTNTTVKKFLDNDRPSGRDKVNKGDVYLLAKNAEDKDIFFGFSIKQSSDATLINWSIEKIIEARDKQIGKTNHARLKYARDEHFKRIGLEKMTSSQFEKLKKDGFREAYDKLREIFNHNMRGHNQYKDTIISILTEDEKYFLSLLIEGIGSITKYETYLFDGNNMINLNNLYFEQKKILDENKMSLLDDNTKDNARIKELKLKEHYSDNDGKIKYYINEDGKFKYRFEIRTKGNPYASLQFQLHKV